MEIIIKREPLTAADQTKVRDLLNALKRIYPEMTVDVAYLVKTDNPAIANLLELIGGKLLDEAPAVIPTAAEEWQPEQTPTETAAQPEKTKKQRRQSLEGTCPQCGGLNRKLMAGLCTPCYQKNWREKKKKQAETAADPAETNVTTGSVETITAAQPDNNNSHPVVIIESERVDAHFLTRHGAIQGKKLG